MSISVPPILYSKFPVRSQDSFYRQQVISLPYSFKNTIESVSVRAGCTLEVYDDSDFSDDAHAFEAPPTADLHHTLDRSFRTRSLDDDIESLRCWC